MTQPTRPVLGHLTTSWTPPSTCFSVRVHGTTPPWNTGYQGQTCNTAGMFGLSDAPDCWPPRTANAPHAPTSQFFSGWGFYSPGTLCPLGYTTACVAKYGETISGWSLQFPLTVGETAAGCCPSGGYKCYSIAPDHEYSQTYTPMQTCWLMAPSTTMEVAPCFRTMEENAASSAMLLQTVTGTLDSISISAIETDSFPVFAPLIQINWRAEDLTDPIPSSTSSSSISTSTGQGGNISGGAIAGIIAGVIFGTVFALAGIAFAITSITGRRRMGCKKVDRNKKDPDAAPAQELMPSIKPQQEIPQPLELPAAEPVYKKRNRVRFAKINYYIPPQAPRSN